jgi:hypothetical protein
MKKRISRLNERGAIFVESIIVVVFFTLCFVGVVFFRELYVKKMHLQRLARASAMGHAMNACQSDIKAGLEDDVTKDTDVQPGAERIPGKPTPARNQDGKTKEALDQFDSTTGGAPLDEVTKITLTSTASASAKKDPSAAGTSFESKVTGQSFVTCGDPVAAGDITQIFPRIGAVFESFFK